MARFALVLILLLAACSPPQGDETVTPAAAPESAPKAAPKRTREPATPRKQRDSKVTLQAGGGVYQYVDESGRVRFAASLEDVPERQRSTAGLTVTRAPARSAPSREDPGDDPAESHNTNAEVVLYTTSTCGYCKKAIAYLDSIGQDYDNRNVETEGEARDEYLRLTNGRTGVPVIVVGNQWMQGWSQTKLDEMLAASR